MLKYVKHMVRQKTMEKIFPSEFLGNEKLQFVCDIRIKVIFSLKKVSLTYLLKKKLTNFSFKKCQIQIIKNYNVKSVTE